VLGLAHGGRISGFEAGDIQNVEEQHGRIGNSGPAGFRHDHRVLDPFRIERCHDGLDDIAAVLVQRVVLAVLVVRLRAVVIDGKTASKIKVTKRRAFLHEVCVVAAGLENTAADVADVRDL